MIFSFHPTHFEQNNDLLTKFEVHLYISELLTCCKIDQLTGECLPVHVPAHHEQVVGAVPLKA